MLLFSLNKKLNHMHEAQFNGIVGRRNVTTWGGWAASVVGCLSVGGLCFYMGYKFKSWPPGTKIIEARGEVVKVDVGTSVDFTSTAKQKFLNILGDDLDVIIHTKNNLRPFYNVVDKINTLITGVDLEHILNLKKYTYLSRVMDPGAGPLLARHEKLLVDNKQVLDDYSFLMREYNIVNEKRYSLQRSYDLLATHSSNTDKDYIALMDSVNVILGMVPEEHFTAAKAIVIATCS